MQIEAPASQGPHSTGVIWLFWGGVGWGLGLLGRPDVPPEPAPAPMESASPKQCRYLVPEPKTQE